MLSLSYSEALTASSIDDLLSQPRQLWDHQHSGTLSIYKESPSHPQVSSPSNSFASSLSLPCVVLAPFRSRFSSCYPCLHLIRKFVQIHFLFKEVIGDGRVPSETWLESTILAKTAWRVVIGFGWPGGREPDAESSSSSSDSGDIESSDSICSVWI